MYAHFKLLHCTCYLLLSSCSDVAVSVTESAEQARTFLTLLLAEIHLQLTTISWLSVNSQVGGQCTCHWYHLGRFASLIFPLRMAAVNHII